MADDTNGRDRKPVLVLKIRKLDKRKLLKRLFVAALLAAACVLGAGLGLLMGARRNLPDVTELERIQPKLITTLYADDGTVVKEFAEERRVVVPYAKLPDLLKKAIIATEDPRFYRHRGIDYRGILRAVKQNLRIGRRGRLEGGSTITQQLAREYFLYPQQLLSRKLKEWLLALQIEKKYSKEQILEMYCNKFFLGHGAAGVEAAANLFFGKSVGDLELEEIAVIAGIFRGPSLYSPYNNQAGTLRRRNHVLTRMVEEGFITAAQAEAVKAKPMTVLPLRRDESDFGAYFFEEVRKHLEKTYGANALYRSGLKVYTTLNPRYQEIAEKAVSAGLRAMDKKKGWRKDKRNLAAEGAADLDKVWLPSWRVPNLEPGDLVEAVVLAAAAKEATLRIKGYTVRMTNAGIQWTKASALDRLIKRGDVVLAAVKSVDEEKKTAEAALDQEPEVEGAFLAVDPLSGQVKAMVGGYSFRRSQFNRATQALRQTGSTIKPIIYTAAIENGFTPATIIQDWSHNFVDKWTGEPWTPPNYDGKYKGAVTVRRGLEESRNVVTAKILDSISPQVGVRYCRKFGITSTVYPYLSLSLGAFEVTLLEMVSAFTTFPNKGVRITPTLITRVEDKDGNVLEEARVESDEVLSPQIAYIMTSMLHGVCSPGGTAWAVSAMDKPFGGKTGTTNKFTDAWFIGFSPSLCAGVWIGYDTQISLGNRQSGAVAALPVWQEFFQAVIDDEKKRAEEAGVEVPFEEFEIPPNLTFAEIDRKTGLLATPFCLFPFREVFVPGTEPVRFCSHQDHLMTLNYYSVERGEEEH
ncbi:MAG: PBP1A family penicillin-binding protein [Candidatus Aminicenantes bacterium]|nr:PBP1A family penicillin-binding protein [Candidatus Aminicenantes bacterium]